MLNECTPIWAPDYFMRASGHREIRHWELAIPIHIGDASFGRRYVGVLVYPDGAIIIGDKRIQCTSVEEAKELGMSTYLLTKGG